MGTQGTGIGGANMWALLLDKDPGHSAAAGDLAADVVDKRKLKKAAPVAVKVEEAPPADNAAKPAKRANKAKVNKKSAAGCSSNQAMAAAAAIVDDTAQKQMNGDLDMKVEAVAATVPYVVAEGVSKEEDEFVDVVARRRTVAGRARKATAAGSSMVVTGHGTTTAVDVDVIDCKLKKPVVLEVAEPARKMANKEKKGADGAGERKQAAALAATVLDGNELTSNGHDEIEATLAALRIKEWEEEEAKEEMFNVVASRGGRRRTVAARTSKVVAEGATNVAGTNMWSLLNDNDPGHGGDKQATKGKRTRTKKKKDAAEASKQADSVDDDEEKETTAAAELLEAETLSQDEKEMASKAAAGGSRCRMVARVCVCMSVLPVATMLALYFHAAV